MERQRRLNTAFRKFDVMGTGESDIFLCVSDGVRVREKCIESHADIGA